MILCQVTWHAITEDIQFVVDGMEVSPCGLGSIYPAVPALQLDIVSTNNGTPAGINSDGRLTCKKKYHSTDQYLPPLQTKLPYLTEKPSLGPRALLPTASLVFNINDRQV